MTELNATSQAMLYMIARLDSYGAAAWNLRIVAISVSLNDTEQDPWRNHGTVPYLAGSKLFLLHCRSISIGLICIVYFNMRFQPPLF